MVKITHVKSIESGQFRCFIINKKSQVSELSFLSESEKQDVQNYFDAEGKLYVKNASNGFLIKLSDELKTSEDARSVGVAVFKALNGLRIKSAGIQVLGDVKQELIHVLEGMLLSSYQFLKYFKQETKTKKQHVCKEIFVLEEQVGKQELNEVITLAEGVFVARDLVNEPQSYLNAVQYANDIKELGQQFGFEVEVFEKSKIESLKMGGLLAVNKGSVIPPTFTVLSYKGEGAVNDKPLALVGKGIVYDTGGLSLKPTPNSMDLMKCDMGGSAAVVGALCAIAKAKLPVNVVAFVPATDNRPGGDAYAPGDVITMHNGLTVEIKNTDAEGRMVLADAMSYAENYKPELLVELATLTGSAVAAIGQEAAVAMGTDKKALVALKEAGERSYERIVEFPFWKEYDEQLKSDIADLKNLGGPTAGAITAGKFLANFTSAPFVHIDIAGPAFISADSAYRTQGGTGYGVRLLFEFVKERYNG